MDFRNTSILVVDDEEDAVLYIAEALKRRGARVQTAVSGIEALGKLRENGAHICLTDIRMPEMDGLELLRRLSKRSILLQR